VALYLVLNALSPHATLQLCLALFVKLFSLLLFSSADNELALFSNKVELCCGVSVAKVVFELNEIIVVTAKKM